MNLNLNQFAEAIWKRAPTAEVTVRRVDEGSIVLEVHLRGKTVRTQSLNEHSEPATLAKMMVTKLYFMLHPHKSYKASIPKTF